MLRGERIPALAELSEIARLVRLNFNSIITDYPDRARQVLEAMGAPID